MADISSPDSRLWRASVCLIPYGSRYNKVWKCFVQCWTNLDGETWKKGDIYSESPCVFMPVGICTEMACVSPIVGNTPPMLSSEPSSSMTGGKLVCSMCCQLMQWVWSFINSFKTCRTLFMTLNLGSWSPEVEWQFFKCICFFFLFF